MTMIIKYGIINIVEFVFLETLLKKTVNFLKIFFSFSLFLIFINSCSNSQESKLVYTENNTIKQSVKGKEEEITWTQELEADRLTKIINRRALVLGADVPYNKEIYKITKPSQGMVFPAVSDFGSLDTSKLNPLIKEKLNNFCSLLIKEDYNSVENYFSRKYIFSYVFFKNDFEEGWKKNFSKETFKPSENIEKWIFGEPFIGSEIIQIPVRFYADCGTIDITVFLSSGGNNEFYQITIDRWQKV